MHRDAISLEQFEGEASGLGEEEQKGSKCFCGLTGYQCFVLFASWLGWGFDVFDGLLFNFASPVCIPNLLGIDPNAELDQSTRETITLWTASLTSLLLLGWAAGGIIFGKLTDTFGRSKIMLATIATYAISTGASAASPNIWFLGACRFCASLGIGGEWAAGASLVAETMPPHMRLWGGAILYTSAPFGLFLASVVSSLFLNQVSFVADNPSLSWRLVFLTGLLPVAFAILIRIRLKEPNSWKDTRQHKQLYYGSIGIYSAEDSPKPMSRGRKLMFMIKDELGEIPELFGPKYRRRTFGGLFVVIVALITWWTLTSFIPLIATFLAQDVGAAKKLDQAGDSGFKGGILVYWHQFL